MLTKRNVLKKDRKSRAERKFARQRELHRTLNKYGKDILYSEKFQSTREYVQHGTIPVYRHCIDVAKQSLIIGRALHIDVSEKEMVRGALLHDYFLYDWHDKSREDYKPLHGFSHAEEALRNAKQDYELTSCEQDIIKKHMWPLNITPPSYREAWLVTLADKYCSTLETLRLRNGAMKGKKDRRG